jgi:hypothetical protein
MVKCWLQGKPVEKKRLHLAKILEFSYRMRLWQSPAKIPETNHYL